MIDGLIIDLPVLALFLKFMIASTLLLGGVWVLEKIGVINTPDMSETAWKLAIVASFVSLLPVSLSPSNLTIPIDQSIAADYGALPQVVSNPSSSEQSTSDQPAPARALPAPAPAPSQLVTRRDAELVARDSERSATAAVRNRQERRPTQTTTPATVEQAVTPDAPAAISRPDRLLIGAWAALALIALATLAVAYSRAIKSLGNRTRVPAEHHANRTLRALCETVDIRHVPYLSRSSDINSPVCLPRREICLPDWAFEDMDEKALDSLIAHELAHMLRRDPAMMIFTSTLSRIFFFQPLFALARRRLEDNAELAADQWAATHLSTARAVASALYTCAQKITEKRQLQWGLAMAGDKSILKQRVERLLSADGASFTTAGRLKRGGLAAVLLAAVISLPSIEFATAMTARHPHDGPSEEEIDRIVRRLERKLGRDVVVSIDTEALRQSEEDIEEMARRLERELKHNIVVPLDPETLRDVERITEDAMRVAEVAVEAAAEAMAEVSVEMAGRPRLSHHFESGNGHHSGNMQWSDDGYTVKVNWDGRFELTDDEKGIKRLARDGSLNIRTNKDGDRRRIRLENEDGDIETTYWRDGDKQPMDAEGEKWLADTIQMLVRRTPIDMENRIERYLEQGGTKLAFKKFDELEADYVRRIFATVLMEETNLKQSDVKRLLKAFEVVESDYDVRLMLAVMLDEKLITKDTLDDALKLTNSIESDYELRLLLTPMLEEFAFDDKNMKQVLERAKSIESDYELRLLLAAAMDAGGLSKANQKRLIDAASSIDSDYELRLVISQFADEADMDEATTNDLLQAIGTISGDYEKRLALASVLDEGDMNDANWLLAIELASTIDGDYEKRLALSQIEDDLPHKDKLTNAWRSAVQSISSERERDRVGRKRGLVGDRD